MIFLQVRRVLKEDGTLWLNLSDTYEGNKEVRYMQSGKVVTTFRIAVKCYMANNESIVDFIPIVAWNKLAEICGNNLLKGRKVLVYGHIQVRHYDDDDSIKRYITEVLAHRIKFMDNKHLNDAAPVSSSDGVNSFGTEVFPDDELPF